MSTLRVGPMMRHRREIILIRNSNKLAKVTGSPKNHHGRLLWSPLRTIPALND